MTKVDRLLFINPSSPSVGFYSPYSFSDMLTPKVFPILYSNVFGHAFCNDAAAAGCADKSLTP